MSEVPWTGDDALPPITLPGSITLVEGTSFVICDPAGDIGGHDGEGIDGLFVADTRVLSDLVLVVEGRRVEPLAWHAGDPGGARIVGRIHAEGQHLLVVRDFEVGLGMTTAVTVRNPAPMDRRVTVELEAAGDMAGLFEVKEGRAHGGPVEAMVDGDVVRLGRPDARRGAVLRPSVPAKLEARGGRARLHWDAVIPARGSWSVVLEVAAVRGGDEVGPPRHRAGGRPQPHEPPSWLVDPPRVHTDVPGLGEAVARAFHDLGALRLVDPEHPDEAVVAAGAPWFMTLFGRDALLTAWMALPFDPVLALDCLRALARLQGTRVVAETDEEPGRIPHEVRLGATDSLSVASGWVYYGSIDATPLFVMVAGELRRWGVPMALLEPLLPAVDAALTWMLTYGDRDGDGYLEYARASDKGLANQGWKDSGDSISFRDGRLAEGPIALAEVQAYAYGAWLAGAELAEAVGDHVRATERRYKARDLQEAFARDFWIPDQRLVALGLDGRKRPIDAVASNMGHCLWTGLLDEEQAAAAAAALMSPEMASGWGVRTLASSMARYDPLSYHNGSVWPHDTALCIAGLRRNRFQVEAGVLALQLLAAFTANGGRLPELYAGLSRDEMGVPVPYPTSCQPQAWASAAPLLLVRSLLALDPDLPNGRVEIDPLLPEGCRTLVVEGIRVGESTISIEVDRDAVAVRGLPRGLAVIRPG